MDLHHHQQPYAQLDGHGQAYDASHSYEAYYASYPQPQYDASAYSHQYYDYSASYQQPPPPGVDHTQHHYAPAPLNEGMKVGAFIHSSEYAVLMDAALGNGGAAQLSSLQCMLPWKWEGGGGRGFRGRGGRRGGRGGFGRGNFRGRGRGRGQEPTQPPAPKPACQPKPHAWCDICRVDCNNLGSLEQHKAGKQHKRGGKWHRRVQRIQEYEAQQKQLAGYQSTIVVSSTTTETGPSVAESVTQTLPAPDAASGTAVASEASTCNPPAKVEIPEGHHKETGAQNPAQPPAPKPARQPKYHAWCNICHVDCNNLGSLEQHKAGKQHKRGGKWHRRLQRIQEYEAQQKQLAGYQSTIVVSSTTTETGPSIAESVPQTLPAPDAASGTAVASEAGTSNPPAKVEIPEGHHKETGAQNPAQPPAPKVARQPKPHAWCDICCVDCNNLGSLEQHKAGKWHKRAEKWHRRVQRIQEYEAQQKQLVGYQSTIVVSSTTTETGQSVAESVPQTLPEPDAASGTAVASEAGTSNPPAKVEIPEGHHKETGAQNLPVTEGPAESVKTRAGETQAPHPSDTTQAEAAPSGKRPFTKSDGYGLGFMYGYGGGRFDRGGRRGGRFDRGGKRPRRFGEFQPWPPMPMPDPASHLPRVRPIVCTLCNVSCDTPAVFDTHVSGKKHQIRIIKLQGPNTVFGPITVFIPPGQPAPYPQNIPEPVFYGLTTPELIKQHEMLMRDQMEDEDEEEEDAGEDDQQNENPEERAEGDGRDEAMINNGTNGISEQSKEHNELVVEPTSGTVGSTTGDENQDTKVAPNNSDVAPGLQTMSEVCEEVVATNNSDVTAGGGGGGGGS